MKVDKQTKYENLRCTIIDFIYDEYEKDKESYESTAKAIELLNSYSPKQKKYYISTKDIFVDHFDLDFNKIKNFEFISKYISELSDYSNIIQVNENFDVNRLNDETLYVKLIRSDPSTIKGKSTLYPILNFKNENEYNSDKPIDLRLNSEEFRIIDYHYFKILTNKGGGTHRTIGICKSLGLLKGCSIKLNHIEYWNIHNKKTIDNVLKFIEILNEMDNIQSIDMENIQSIDNENYIIKIYLMDNLKLYIKFKKISEALNYILSDKFKNLTSYIQDMSVYKIEIYDSDIYIYSTNEKEKEHFYKKNIDITNDMKKLYYGYKAYKKHLASNNLFKLKNRFICMQNNLHINKVSALGRYAAYKQFEANLEKKKEKTNCILGSYLRKLSLSFILISIIALIELY